MLFHLQIRLPFLRFLHRFFRFPSLTAVNKPGTLTPIHRTVPNVSAIQITMMPQTILQLPPHDLRQLRIFTFAGGICVEIISITAVIWSPICFLGKIVAFILEV